MFYTFFKKCKIPSYFHILDLYVTELDIYFTSNHMQQNSVMVFFLLFENKVDLDHFLKFLSLTIVLRSNTLLIFGAKLLYLHLKKVFVSNDETSYPGNETTFKQPLTKL